MAAPLQKLRTFKKKSQLHIDLSSILLQNLNFKRRKSIFYLKYVFCRPLDFAAWMQPTHSLPPRSYALSGVNIGS